MDHLALARAERADRFDLRRDIQFETRVTPPTFDEAAKPWVVETDRGDRSRARFCIMATGCLSAARVPGLSSFAGACFHTGVWPQQKVDFTGRRVALIGTGSSGLQATPEIARDAAHLTVFQRTPNCVVPARNGKLDRETIRFWKDDYWVVMPYVDGIGRYRKKCDEVAANGYEGFQIAG